MSSNVKLPNGMELVFAPGCFDNFEGTQEELDELVKEIQEAFTSGRAMEEAKALDPDEFVNNLSDEEIEFLINQIEEEEGLEEGSTKPKRTLQ